MASVVAPTFPGTMNDKDLIFDALMDVLIADDIYFGEGAYVDEGEVESLYGTQTLVQEQLSTVLARLGELAEKPGKTDSKITKLKTRNYTIPGKRTSTVELTIAGISNTQKNYFESSAFMRFGMGEYIPYGTANDLFMMCITVLEDHKDTIIVVDEIDYAFRHPQLLGAIRDIVDVTTAIVILVGMQNAKDKLNQINEYYFDRCNFFYEFQDLPKRDIAQLCSEILEIKFHPDIVDYVHFHSCGNVRKAMKLIRSVEEIGRYKNLEVVSQADLDD